MLDKTKKSKGLTLGTKMSPIDRKLQSIMARDTKAKVASCWLPMMREIGAVITHSTWGGHLRHSYRQKGKDELENKISRWRSRERKCGESRTKP